MKVTVPIICYGGTVHAHYMQGMLGLVNQLAAKGISVDYPLIYFESLISRARNASAAAALSNKSDYLFFIDTDITFEPKDFFKLLEADKDVCVGLYPKKYISQQKLQFLFKKFSQLPSCWKELVGDFSSEFSEGRESRIIEVNYSATGFMLIKTDVFIEIVKQKPEIKYNNDIDGYAPYGDNFYDFFRCQVNPETKKYESEDYGFCKLWQECGGKIHAIPDIKLGHRGNYIFKGSLKEQQKAFR